MKFANLFDAGVELGARLADLPSEVLLAPIMPNGVPVALGIESVMGVRDLAPLHVERTSTGVQVAGFTANLDREINLASRIVVVVDDGVETGTAARACGTWLKEQGVLHCVLAVPVCPKTAINSLQFLYQSIVSVNSPLGTQALSWHFQDFDVIDMDTATALLSAREQQLGQ